MKIKYVQNDDQRSEGFNKLIKESYTEFIKEDNPDLILVSGGDGSLLHAIQNYNHFQAPFLGRSAGTLNFLMNKFSDDRRIINDLINKRLSLNYIKTRGIKVSIENQDRDKQTLGTAVNDVVFGSSIMGYHSFKLNSKDFSFRNFKLKGTGICISTELGSTAYNFNLGGPVLPLGSNLWTVVGVATNRYLNDILKSQEMVIECINDSFFVFIDGIKTQKQLEKGDKIILNQGSQAKIAFFDKSGFLKKRVEFERIDKSNDSNH